MERGCGAGTERTAEIPDMPYALSAFFCRSRFAHAPLTCSAYYSMFDPVRYFDGPVTMRGFTGESPVHYLFGNKKESCHQTSYLKHGKAATVTKQCCTAKLKDTFPNSTNFLKTTPQT